MDKRGSVKRLMFEIAYIVFSSAIGLAVLYFVLISVDDTSLQTKIYAEDIEQTLNIMQISDADILKVKYNLPEHIKFIQENNQIFLSDDKTKLEIKYTKRENTVFKFNREENILFVEKNEKLS